MQNGLKCLTILLYLNVKTPDFSKSTKVKVKMQKFQENINFSEKTTHGNID